MTPFATRALLPAALLTFASATGAVGNADQKIRVDCGLGTGQPLCIGLREAIAGRFPGQVVTEATTQATVLRPITRMPRADELSGQLFWTDPEGQIHQSRVLQLTVMDAALSDDMLRQFGAQLAEFFTPDV